MKMKRGGMVGWNGCLGYEYNKETKILPVNRKQNTEQSNMYLIKDHSKVLVSREQFEAVQNIFRERGKSYSRIHG